MLFQSPASLGAKRDKIARDPLTSLAKEHNLVPEGTGGFEPPVPVLQTMCGHTTDHKSQDLKLVPHELCSGRRRIGSFYSTRCQKDRIAIMTVLSRVTDLNAAHLLTLISSNVLRRHNLCFMPEPYPKTGVLGSPRAICSTGRDRSPLATIRLCLSWG